MDEKKQEQRPQYFYFNDDGKLVVESNKGVWVNGEQHVKMYGNFTCNAKTLGAIISKLKGIKVEVGSTTTNTVYGYSLSDARSTEYVTVEYCVLNVDEDRIDETIQRKADELATTRYAQQCADFVHKNSKEVEQLRECIDNFNTLPWCKRIFKKIEVKKTMESNELITKDTLERYGFVFVEKYGMMQWMEDLGSRNGGFEVCWTEDLNLLQIRGKGISLDLFGCSYLQQMQNIMKVLGINKKITQ